MNDGANSRVVEWHRPWHRALTTGLAWAEEEDSRGGAVVRRLGRVILYWAKDEGLGELEARALAVTESGDEGLLEAGQALADLLDGYVPGESPGGSSPPADGSPDVGRSAPVDGAGEPVRVLHAEDDPMSATLLGHGLGEEGFQVLHFPDGTSALEGAFSNTVDCVILDVKMPGMDGLQVLERLRETPAYRTVPILMLTSLGTEEDIVQGFALGADDYMLKPFSPREVSARIRRLLEG